MKTILSFGLLFFTLSAHAEPTAAPTAVEEKPFAPLAGTFALKIVTTGKVNLPLVGEKTPKGQILFLIKRTWNEEKKHYVRKASMCDGTSGSMFGISTEVSRKGYQGIPASTSVVKVDSSHQKMTIRNELFLWGMKNLANPLTAKLPQSLEEAQSAAFKNIVYDVDRDGHVGITIKARGLLEGELHAVQRRVTQFDGRALSPDHQVGHVKVVRESIILESTTALIGEGPRSPQQHPDPSRSWFEAIRLPDQSTCQAVNAL